MSRMHMENQATTSLHACVQVACMCHGSDQNSRLDERIRACALVPERDISFDCGVED